jgi:hypothetical protein
MANQGIAAINFAAPLSGGGCVIGFVDEVNGRALRRLNGLYQLGTNSINCFMSWAKRKAELGFQMWCDQRT